MDARTILVIHLKQVTYSNESVCIIAGDPTAIKYSSQTGCIHVLVNHSHSIIVTETLLVRVSSKGLWAIVWHQCPSSSSLFTHDHYLHVLLAFLPFLVIWHSMQLDSHQKLLGLLTANGYWATIWGTTGH